MKFLRIVGWILGTLVIVGGIATVIAMWAYQDIPASELEEKYANEASRFMNLEGARIHYRDEGPRNGPAILLMHANFSSLLSWEPWADALKDKYRVVRFDLTSHGLTGPDAKGDYTQERSLELMEQFVDAVGLQTFSVGGTSLGGTMSILYAAKHPERIENVILLSPGSVEGRERKEGPRGQMPDAAYVLKYIMPRALPKVFLTGGFVNDDNLPEELIDEWFELWRYPGQREAQLDRLSQYVSGDIDRKFAAVDVPVLLLWGEKNETALFEQHEEILHWLENADPIHFISYPELGHMALQEAGAEIAVDVRAFLDGTLSDEYIVERHHDDSIDEDHEDDADHQSDE